MYLSFFLEFFFFLDLCVGDFYCSVGCLVIGDRWGFKSLRILGLEGSSSNSRSSNFKEKQLKWTFVGSIEFFFANLDLRAYDIGPTISRKLHKVIFRLNATKR